MKDIDPAEEFARRYNQLEKNGCEPKIIYLPNPTDSQKQTDIPSLLSDCLNLLKEIEWNSEFDGELCPSCKGGKGPGDAKDPGHRDDCLLLPLIFL